MLDILHKYHFATGGMVSTAKAYMYWPNIKDDIDMVYKQCKICTTEQKAKDKSIPMEPAATKL